MPSWIDFKELRSKLDFEAVLTHYGVEVKKKGVQHLGLCPLPGHQTKKDVPSFSANLEKGIFNCFGCRAKGNVLDFAVLMNGKSPEDGREVKKVAAELRARFCPDMPGQEARGATSGKPEEPPTRQLELGAEINPPLDFELKDLDPRSPFLTGRGLSPETIAYFGLGFCTRGSLNGHIAIPLHDDEGHLIGYAGRIGDDTAINGHTPKYRFPATRERAGRTLEFRKDLFVYNGNRVKPGADVIVVQGFSSVWWLHQHGFPRVVATMGSECSSEQLELLVATTKPNGRILLVPNADLAGKNLAERLLSALSPYRWVKWCQLEWGRKPTDLTAERLTECFR